MKKFFSFSLVAIYFFTTLIFSGCSKPLHANARNIPLNVSGTIEVKEVNVLSKLPGKIEKLSVEENQNVKAGDIIAILSSDELKAKEEQAQALVEAAYTQLEQARSSVEMQEEIVKSNIERANAALETAQSQYDKAKNGARKEEIEQAQIGYSILKSTYDKVKYLADKGAVSKQKEDEVKAEMDVAKARLGMVNEGARPEDIKAAESLVTQARAAVDAANTGNIQIDLAKQNVTAANAKYNQALGGLQEVKAYLKDTKIVSPINGTVTLLNINEGELVATGYPIAIVSDMNNMWVNAKLKETDLSKVSIGDKLEITVAAYPNEVFDGIVSSIDKKPDFAAKRSTNERGEEDIMSFNVKVKLANIEGKLRPGLTAHVKI